MDSSENVIVIFHRESSELRVKRLCVADVKRTKGSELTFSTAEWLSPALDSHYYVMTELQEDQPSRLREISIYENKEKQKPYTYTVTLGQEWSGFVDDEDKSV